MTVSVDGSVIARERTAHVAASRARLNTRGSIELVSTPLYVAASYRGARVAVARTASRDVALSRAMPAALDITTSDTAANSTRRTDKRTGIGLVTL